MGLCQGHYRDPDATIFDLGSTAGLSPDSPNMRNSSPMRIRQKLSSVKISPQNFVKEKKINLEELYDLDPTPLGEGSYGQVRKARYRPTNEQRAVKIMLKEGQTKEEHQRLINEVKILARLDHPNIIKVYEFFQDDSCFYIVTELCTGGELFDKIAQMQSFSEEKVADILRQILSVVAYCHGNRIVHRDLKPENLLLESENEDAVIKVIDFGLSRMFDPLRKMQKQRGTPHYNAPEVIKGVYDEKCDVWSCGVIAYILHGGYHPFDGETDSEVTKLITKGKFEFHPERWSGVSEGAKKLITRMMEFDPAQRISAQEALDDPWLKSFENKDLHQIDAISVAGAFNNLRTFRTPKKLALATYLFIVSYLASSSEKAKLRKLFQQLDKNNDGYLSQDELKEGYANFYGPNSDAENFADTVMKVIDNNKNGKIDYLEFLVAAMDRREIASEERLEAAFKAFDRDGNGFLEIDELKGAFEDHGAPVSDNAWQKLIKEVDENGDGKISFLEFRDMMMASFCESMELLRAL